MAEPGGRIRSFGWPIRLSLAAVVVGAMALSAWWLWRVPMFQAPDEDVHFDYVVSLRTAGRLLRASERPVAEMAPGGFFHPYNPLTHPYTLHLELWTRARELREHPEIKVPLGYGSREHFAAIDRTAPPLAGSPSRQPFLVSEYPLGYYALAALWTGAWARVFPGPVATFFAARAFSVLLLGFGLLATFGVLRRLGARPWNALALTAAVAFFPMTSFVSSYVQPDNLVFVALTLCMWLALGAARGGPPRRRALFAIGLALALLQLAKLHVFLAAAVPVFASLALAEAARGGGRWVEWGSLLAGPSLLAAELQLWVMGGGGGEALRTLGDAHLRWPSPGGAARALLSAAEDFLKVDGAVFGNFWGRFGWLDTPLVIGSQPVQDVVGWLLLAGSVILLALLAVRGKQVAGIAMRQWRRGRAGRALGLMLANPFVNAHGIFAAEVIAVYVLINNASPAQGRHWYCLLPIMFWEAVYCAPRALRSRRVSRWLSNGVLAALLLYSLVGSYWAMRAVEERFYGAPGQRTPAVRWP